MLRKKYFFCFLLLPLLGCENKITPPPLPSTKTVLIQNQAGEELGHGIEIAPYQYLTVDHLLRNRSSLYVKNNPTRVKARSTKNDLLWINQGGTIPPDFLSSLNKESPKIGEEVHWKSDEGLRKAVVTQLNQELMIERKRVESLGTISQLVARGDSGKPLLDQSGKVVGLIVGGDKRKDQSYFVPTYVLEKFLRFEENKSGEG